MSSWIKFGIQTKLFVNEREIAFTYPIAYSRSLEGTYLAVIEKNDFLIIVLRVDQPQENDFEAFSRNIYALDRNGNIVWRIQSPVHYNTGTPLLDMTYTGIGRDKVLMDGNQCISYYDRDKHPNAVEMEKDVAYTPGGNVYELNLKDGTVKFLYWSRA